MTKGLKVTLIAVGSVISAAIAAVIVVANVPSIRNAITGCDLDYEGEEDWA